MQDIAINITGMSCGHCLNAVSKAITSVNGVEVRGLRIGRADLRVSDDSSVALLTAAIEDAGYGVEGVIRG
jgi:copper chaperone CopZ